MSTIDASCGNVVVYKGERYVSRGSATPGRITIAREDNPRVWRIVSQHELAQAIAPAREPEVRP